MSTTPSAAIAAVYAQIAANADTPDSRPAATLAALGVTRVYDHEPATNAVDTPVGVTLCSAGWTPDHWIVDSRVYVSGKAYDARQQQQILRDVAYQLDQLIDTEGPSQSEAAWVPELECWVQTNRYMIGREDF